MLKMAIKTFFIGLIILFNCQQLLAKTVGNGNMLPTTGKYYKQVLSMMANSYCEGNYVISPMVMVMLDYIFYAAATDDTREEYEHFYFYMKNSKEIFEALQLPLFDVPTKSQNLRLSQSTEQILNLGASITLDDKFKENPGVKTFLALIRNTFQSIVSFEDLSKNSEVARGKINRWVQEFTRGKISNILPSITSGSKLVVASALYLRVNWLYSFNLLPKQQAFYALNGEGIFEQRVTFMTMSEFAYGNYEAYSHGLVKAVRIPLQRMGMAMIIYMPERFAFNNFLEEWEKDNSFLDQILTKPIRKSKNNRCRLKVTMPKFTIPARSDSLNMVPVHKKFGLTTMFSLFVPSLKFSDEVGIRAVSAYYHKAMVIVDEVGIEGAAACGGDCADGIPPRPDEVVDILIDHPFLFQVVGYPSEGEGKMVYFTGQVTDAKLAQQ